jgi:hypothetical protein
LHMIDTVPSPKVVCIGGSASAFSLDGGQLSDSLGLPVVNAGMSASMGYKSIMTLAADRLKHGDIALFVLEHGFYFNRQNQGNGDKAFYEFLATNPLYFKHMNMDQWLNMPAFVNEVTSANFKRWQNQAHYNHIVYGRQGIDAYGTMKGHKDGKPTKAIPSVKKMKYKKQVSPAFLSYANDVFAALRKRGVKVFVAYPAASESYAWKPTLDQTMGAELNAIKLGNPHEVIYPDTLFFDTDYHLRYEHRGAYTATLARHLKSALKH